MPTKKEEAEMLLEEIERENTRYGLDESDNFEEEPFEPISEIKDTHSDDDLNNSRLGCARAKLAKKLGIKTKLPEPIKKFEKRISDKLLGKVRETENV